MSGGGGFDFGPSFQPNRTQNFGRIVMFSGVFSCIKKIRVFVLFGGENKEHPKKKEDLNAHLSFFVIFQYQNSHVRISQFIKIIFNLHFKNFKNTNRLIDDNQKTS